MNDFSAQSNLHLTLTPRPRVAILVDGDNVPHSAVSEIEAKAAALGNPILRRVYADMGLRKDWAAETDYLATHCTTSAGKNRADIQLVIAAMDIAHRSLATHFLILSDDRDFGPLVAHLREIGMTVEWAGKPKPTPKPIAVPIPPKTKMLSAVDQRLHAVFQAQKPSLSLQTLGSQMKQGTVLEQTQKATWRAYLSTKPDLYVLTGTGAATVVTLKTP
jgi:hypothetical protein